MEVIRVTEEWQRAGVHYVRTEGMVKEFHFGLDQEFETDTPETEYILVLDDYLPVGTCRIHYLPEEKTAKIERVCVIPEYRGKGVGRLVIEGAESWIKEKGYDYVAITSRDVAVGFYEAIGYTADYTKEVIGDVFPLVYVEKYL